MTNYERICADKAFCASILADGMDSLWYEKFLEWLDTEQREVTDEHGMTSKIELPSELYTHEVLPDGRTVTTCTMRQQILHCIGMVDSCAHKPYTRHGKKFYRPWRNYFTTNQPDAEWDKLCEAGYAAHGNVSDSGVTYWMTRAGLDWLGKELEVHIYDESN